MGTFVAIEATADNAKAADAALDAGFAALLTVATRLHPTKPGSDLASIRQAALDEPVTVHPSTIELLHLALRLHASTGGTFDPCIPGDAERPGTLDDIDLQRGFVRRRPVALDFGGFAKGFAVDQAIEALQHRGCIRGIVNAGGDLRTFGAQHEPLWIRLPDGGLRSIELRDAALCVSDANASSPPPEHRGYYRRVTATRAAAAPGRRFAAVVAPSGVVADALSTCALLCDDAVVTRICREFDARLVPI